MSDAAQQLQLLELENLSRQSEESSAAQRIARKAALLGQFQPMAEVEEQSDDYSESSEGSSRQRAHAQDVAEKDTELEETKSDTDTKNETGETLLSTPQVEESSELDTTGGGRGWQMSDLITLQAGPAQKLVGLESVGSRLFVMLSDLTLHEVDLNSGELLSSHRISEIEECQACREASACAVFSDLNILLVATEEQVHLFDYENGLQHMTAVPAPAVTYVCCVDMYIVF